MPAASGDFIWYELITTDLAGAETFYKAVVGWNTEPFPGSEASPYIVLKAGDVGVGGMMTIPPEAKAMGAPPCWSGYIYAADIDAAAESLKQAGGAVHRGPWDVPGVGKLAVVADPQGAMFMFMTPDPSMGDGGGTVQPSAVGSIGWRELYANDWASAFDFYAGQFGWTKDRLIDVGHMGHYQLFNTGGEAIGGIMNKPPSIPTPVWVYYFTVDAIDAAIERVTAGGGTLLMPAMEVPGGSWVAQCTDPQGAWFALVAPRR